jgi:hypothetical protein
MPRDYLEELDNRVKANAFIQEATTSSTAEISRAHAASTIYLAYQTKTAGEKLAQSVGSLTSALEEALASHVEALRLAAESSETYARSLNFATWALVFATLVLTAVQAITLYKGCP